MRDPTSSVSSPTSMWSTRTATGPRNGPSGGPRLAVRRAQAYAQRRAAPPREHSPPRLLVSLSNYCLPYRLSVPSCLTSIIERSSRAHLSARLGHIAVAGMAGCYRGGIPWQSERRPRRLSQRTRPRAKPAPNQRRRLPRARTPRPQQAAECQSNSTPTKGKSESTSKGSARLGNERALAERTAEDKKFLNKVGDKLSASTHTAKWISSLDQHGSQRAVSGDPPSRCHPALGGRWTGRTGDSAQHPA